MMKNITVPSLLFFAASFLFSPAILHAQVQGPAGCDVLSIEAGYATFALPHFRQSLDRSIAAMAVYNIPMQKLTEFPDNWLAGGAYSYRATESVRIDAGAWYTQTKGAIGYRDPHGSVSEEIRLHIVYARAGGQIDVFKSGDVDWYSAVHAGLLVTRLEVDDNIDFYELSDYNGASGYMSRSYYLTGDLAVGARTQVMGAVVSVECGYRLNKEDHSADLSDDLSGWTLSSRLGIPLPW